jgi:hypothetical protein
MALGSLKLMRFARKPGLFLFVNLAPSAEVRDQVAHKRRDTFRSRPLLDPPFLCGLLFLSSISTALSVLLRLCSSVQGLGLVQHHHQSSHESDRLPTPVNHLPPGPDPAIVAPPSSVRLPDATRNIFRTTVRNLGIARNLTTHLIKRS